MPDSAIHQPSRPAWRHYLPLALLVLAGYLLYLPLTSYPGLVYDAELYWFIAIYFHKAGSLSLLHFHDAMRGYVWPLLLLPARVAQFYSGLPPLLFTRVLGALTAAGGFGLLGPLLWQAVRAQAAPLSWRRRLGFAGLGFLLWRDHFNFPLTDFPALGALGLGLLLLYRRPGRLAPALAAGLCLAAATNLRPIYLAAVPFFLALQWTLLPTGLSPGRRAGAVAALLLGAALVLGPQLLINQRHFGRATPLVLAQDANIAPGTLYRFKLLRGLKFQKYETSIGADYPQSVLFFFDPAGRRFVEREHVQEFRSTAEYARLVLRHPGFFAGLYLRRLFNGLDVQYPTPYIRQVYTPTWGLAALNYSVWFAAALVAWHRRRGLSPPLRLTLVVLLLPCLLVLPTDVECRYLLPLHLLLYALVCFGWPAEWRPARFSRRRLGLVGAAYAVFLTLCFATSAATQAQLEYGGRSLLGQQLPAPKP
ncbi:hypothetical protein [Hymenobacter edaphi]|uniref:Glycosyltransferase RgtA/B/C/D-like domain-containing protein n=1 Tax=Hymenobacter edaphi TaxID=2211146 RepID=A0A328BSJ6_9BACT|nr:hypothetical protein [Hymenobacter edaphi]RAK69665.1 hypothetical protein DLM85_02055 [Hymenobacter edaphi]